MGKEVINIEECFEEKQKFTKEIASNELKQLQIHIIDIQIITDDKEYEYYALMSKILYR